MQTKLGIVNPYAHLPSFFPLAPASILGSNKQKKTKNIHTHTHKMDAVGTVIVHIHQDSVICDYAKRLFLVDAQTYGTIEHSRAEYILD